MKDLIKKLLNEALGVPSGIVDTGNMIYSQLLDEVKKMSNKSPYKEYEITLRGNYEISDYKFNKTIIHFNLEHIKGLEDIVAFGLSYRFKVRFDEKDVKTSVIISKDKVELSINLGIPDDKNMEDVYNYLTQEKDLLSSAITHELKHAYDSYKKPHNKAEYRADYESYMNTRFGIPPIDDFFHYLYFIHSIENLVRPSEVAAELQNGEIDKKGFLEFLKNNRTYSTLKKINNFSYEQFRNDIKDNLDIVKTRLSQNEIDIPNDDDEVVELILRLVYQNLINSKAENLKSDLTTNLFEKLLGFSGKKDEVFRKYIKRINKHKNHNDFFNNEEKMFKFVSGNLIKKINKLYAMLKDTKETKQSILDWDLHYKSKGIEPKIESSEKYIIPKNKKPLS